MENLERIEGIVILDKNGDRVLGKYNSIGGLSLSKDQLSIEKKLEEQLNSSNTEIGLVSIGSYLAISMQHTDFYLVLIAKDSENELLLENLLDTINEGIGYFCGKKVNLALLFRYYTEILLLIDEVINNGLIVSLDSDELVARVMMQDKWKESRAGVPKKGIFM